MTGPTLSFSPKNGRPQVGFVKIVRAARSASTSQGMLTSVPLQNRRNTSATVITFAAMLAAYVASEIRTPNRPKSER